MLPINASLMPAVRTRQALLIIDFQTDFISPDGALPVTEPEGFVSRTVNFIQAFREADLGDVIWVLSEFAENRTLSGDGDQIITSNLPLVTKRATSRSSRGRTPIAPKQQETAQEEDEEAFLSVGEASGKKNCVISGTAGAKLSSEVLSAFDPARDITITKTHYSAFASGQRLVQTLRGRLVTEMYVCGTLSNISTYATALDAGKHGYDMTILEDCCGYRNEVRHLNALKQLREMLGSEPMSSHQVLDIIRPKPAKQSRSSQARGAAATQKTVPTVKTASTGLSPLISSVTLSSTPGEVPSIPPLTGSKPTEKQLDSVEVDNIATEDSVPPPRATSPGDHGLTAVRASPEKPQPPHPGGTPKRPANQSQSSLKETSVKIAKLPDKEASVPSDNSDKPEEVQRGTGQEPDASPKPDGNDLDKSVMVEPKSAGKKKRASAAAKKPQPGDDGAVEQSTLCEGDTTIITDVLPSTLAADAFDRLKKEVAWAGMSHLGGEVPRRVAVQGEVDDEGNLPVYRHPSDESPPLFPFTPTVLEIKNATEKHLGHSLNHVLIQHYRSGNDYISEHSDKTLDIVRGSFIANVSLGAERTMVFRTKRPEKDPSKGPVKEADADIPNSSAQKLETTATPLPEQLPQKRQVERATLPHNSLCRMGLKTNERWLHAIKQDKRADRDRTAPELAYGGERISLTFRKIGTFVDKSQSLIWGQGATSKTRQDARPVVNGQTPDAVRMLQAFGNENHSSTFDWEARYGQGFDVMHMGTPKRFCRGPDPVLNMQVDIALAEFGVSFANGSVGTGVRLEDNDAGHATVEGCSAVLSYLEAVYGSGRRYDHISQASLGKRFERFYRAVALLDDWRRVVNDKCPQAEDTSDQPLSPALQKSLAGNASSLLKTWSHWAIEEAAIVSKLQSETNSAKPEARPFYIAGGDAPSFADFALWPILSEIARVCGEGVLEAGPGRLGDYYRTFGKRAAVVKVLHASQGKNK